MEFRLPGGSAKTDGETRGFVLLRKTSSCVTGISPAAQDTMRKKGLLSNDE